MSTAAHLHSKRNKVNYLSQLGLLGGILLSVTICKKSNISKCDCKCNFCIFCALYSPENYQTNGSTICLMTMQVFKEASKTPDQKPVASYLFPT